MMTMGQARRADGIPEREYIKRGDSVDRIATIRTLARVFGPPDHRYLHVDDNISLVWSVDRDVKIIVRKNGSITS